MVLSVNQVQIDLWFLSEHLPLRVVEGMSRVVSVGDGRGEEHERGSQESGGMNRSEVARKRESEGGSESAREVERAERGNKGGKGERVGEEGWEGKGGRDGNGREEVGRGGRGGREGRERR